MLLVDEYILKETYLQKICLFMCESLEYIDKSVEIGQNMYKYGFCSLVLGGI